MITRFFIAALIVLGMYGAALFVRDRDMPAQPTPLEMKLQDLPTSLGDWRGEPVTLDPEIFKAIGAETVLERLYHNSRGQTISLHLAVFTKTIFYGPPPHTPEQCYALNGWQLGDPTFISLNPDGTNGNLGKLLPAERRGGTVYVLFWYQMDGHVYCTGDQQRQIFHSLRGRSVRPPIVKVMLQMSGATPEECRSTLSAFAAAVFAWTKNFH